MLAPVEVVQTMTALAEEVMAGMTSQKSLGPGIALVDMVVPPGKVVHCWLKLLSEHNLREYLRVADLIGPIADLVGWVLTVLEAASESTGSWSHSYWPYLTRYDRTTPECKPVSVEH